MTKRWWTEQVTRRPADNARPARGRSAPSGVGRRPVRVRSGFCKAVAEAWDARRGIAKDGHRDGVGRQRARVSRKLVISEGVNRRTAT